MAVAALSGPWDSRKVGCCSCGYTATWTLVENGDMLSLFESAGRCCFIMPNCFLKRVQLHKVREGRWEGHMVLKKVIVEAMPDGTLNFMSTDGLLILTRL